MNFYLEEGSLNHFLIVYKKKWRLFKCFKKIFKIILNKLIKL
jgi:hypothetical protein